MTDSSSTCPANQVLVNSTRIPRVTGRQKQLMIQGSKAGGSLWFSRSQKHRPAWKTPISAIPQPKWECGRAAGSGEYQLTEEDVLGAARFDDVIVRNTGAEIHNPAGGGTKFVRLWSGVV